MLLLEGTSWEYQAVGTAGPVGYIFDESSVWVGPAVDSGMPEARPAVQRQDVRTPER